MRISQVKKYYNFYNYQIMTIDFSIIKFSTNEKDINCFMYLSIIKNIDS